MKKLLLASTVALSCFSCNNEPNNASLDKTPSINKADSTPSKTIATKYQISWRGQLNNKTNISLNYQIEEDLIMGHLVYLDTKEQKPIRILGTIDTDGEYRLLEFSPDGNITGILTGKPELTTFNGTWFSPKTRKELSMRLQTGTDSIPEEINAVNKEATTGAYYYQFSDEGYQGSLDINKVSAQTISFHIFSVTGHPGRNIAYIDSDTISWTTDFTYKVPETDGCEFRIRLFKDFVYVNYTKGYCSGQFGHNATVEGFFYKEQKK